MTNFINKDVSKEEMITVTFPDGKTKEYNKGITLLEIAKSIGPRLADAALAAKIDDKIVDLSCVVEQDTKVQILTFNDALGKEVFRHSSAHVLAHAVKRLFPSALPTIGPVVDEGFFYDFDFRPFTPEDLKKIEEEMQKIVKENHPVKRVEYKTKDEAKKIFHENKYKCELIQSAEEGLSAYQQGDFIDLCRGPHVSFTGKIKAFKLTKNASAYWKGDVKNKQLSRIYGVSFPEKKMLDEHLHMLEEAEKRDHRKLGKELDLFFFSDLVGSGLPLWTPKGTILRDLLDGFIWQLRRERGYQRVTIPHITKKELYMISGHWQKYADDLFKIKTRDGHEFAMKPMNCPHHTQIFNHVQRSYRDMPQRYAETTMVYRDEQTGELAGLSRVLCITQDDAHVFCREQHVKEEFFKIWDIIKIFYGSFGFTLQARLSLHDPAHFEKYLGTKESWKFAEDQLRNFAKERNEQVVEAIGEAAFYGPKVDFIAQDSLGRKWQVATIQVDRNMPERFDLFCINEKGDKERIVMMHAAIMGSTERFLSVVIEHLAGKFPLWVTPVQVRILPIADRHNEYCYTLQKQMQENNLRVEVDSVAETTPKKVRQAQLDQVNYILVVGDKEIENKTVNVRTRDNIVHGEKNVAEFIEELLKEVKEKKQ